MEAGERPGESNSLWLIGENGSKPRKLDVEALRSWAVAPDGGRVAVKSGIDTVSIVPLAGGPARTIRGLNVYAANRSLASLIVAEGLR